MNPNELLKLQPEEYFERWTEEVLSTRPLDESEVRNAVKGLYSLLPSTGDSPQVVLCQSPWQMSMVPILCGFFGNSSGLDINRLYSEMEELEQAESDFYRIGVAFLRNKCSSIKYGEVGKLLLSDFYNKYFEFEADISLGSKTLRENPEIFQLMLDVRDFRFRQFVAETYQRTVVPDPEVGLYFFTTDRTRAVSSVDSQMDRTRSPAGDYFYELYRPYYYKEVLFDGLPSEMNATNLKMKPGFVESEVFNLLTKRGLVDRIVHAFYNQNFLDVRAEAARFLHVMFTVATAAHDYLPFEQLCLVSERPCSISVDSENRLHSQSGPALEYSDGYCIYAVDGVIIPAWIIAHPERITCEKITTERNTELRRIMLEQFGEDRYITELGAEEIQADECGRLYRVRFPEGGEDLVMVRVINSSADADGTTREYWLRVPPTIESARQAVAWTFDLEEQDYNPEIES